MTLKNRRPFRTSLLAVFFLFLFSGTALAAQVSGLKAVVKDRTAELSWNGLTGTAAYEIYRSASPKSGFTKIGAAGGTAYKATKLDYGTTYYFKVRALLTNGKYSEDSAAVKVSVATPTLSGLKVTVSKQTAKLSWTALSGAKSYEIYRSDAAQSGFTKIAAITGTSYNAAKLTPGTTYSFKVRALFSNNVYSKESAVVKAPIANVAVSGLSVSVSGNSAELSWKKLSGTKTYEIYRSDSPSSGFKKIGTASSASFKASDLPYGAVSYFKVRARFTSGSCSNYSTIVKAIIPEAKITKLKAAVSGNAVKLSWTALSGVKACEIYRSASPKSGFKKIGKASASAYTDSELSYDSTYYYKVRARLSNGKYSTFSAIVKAVIPEAKITGLKASVSGNSVKLSWTALSGVKAYEIYRSASAQSGFKKIDKASAAAYTAAGQSYGTTSYFKVRALLSNGGYSTSSAIVKAVIPEAKITGLKASVSGNSVKLSWTALSGVKAYEIYRSASAQSGFKKIDKTTAAAYTAAGLSYSTTYYYKVRALLANGEYSKYSDVLKAVTPTLKISGLDITVSGTTVQLTWSKLTGAKSYEVYRSSSPTSGFTRLKTTTAVSYKASGMNEGDVYYFKVRALLSNGEYSKYSSVISVIIPATEIKGLEASAVNESTAKLTWKARSGVKLYEIYRSTSAYSGFTKIGTATGTTYKATGLNWGTTYYFKVRALFTSSEYGEYSDVSYVDIPSIQINGLNVVSNGFNQAHLTWTPLPFELKSLLIYVSDSPTSGFKSICHLGGVSSGLEALDMDESYCFDGINLGETTYWKMIAEIKDGRQFCSSVFKLDPLPNLITNLQANVNNRTVTLSWNPVTNAKSYEINNAYYDDFGSHLNKIGATTDTSFDYTVPGLNCPASCTFFVRALLNDGTYSNYGNVNVDVNNPGIVTAETIGQTVRLHWDDVYDEWYRGYNSDPYYDIYSSISSTDGFTKIGQTSRTSYEVSGLDPETIYYFKVGCSYNGKYIYSSIVTVDLQNIQHYEYGTCSWYISTDGILHISPISGDSCQLPELLYRDSSPWKDLKDIVSIESSGIIKAGSYIQFMFSGCSSLSDLTGLQSLDVSNVTSMYSMFYGCSSLSDLTGLQSWDVSNVTNMVSMFYGCSSLNDLTGLQSWDVSNVTSIGSMFYGCSSLSDLTGLQSWDVSNVTSMGYMFYGCSSLSDLTGLHSWDVSNVTSMGGVFYGCSSLSDLTGLQSWDVSKVTDFRYMFYNTKALCSDIPEWKISSTADTRDMFTNSNGKCSSPSTAARANSAAANSEITEECSEDGNSCTISEKVCTETECTVTSKVCVTVGGQRACADPVVTVVPVLTATPEEEVTPSAEPAEEISAAETQSTDPAAETPVEEATEAPGIETVEECSEDGSSCTIREKVCTKTECTVTSRVCVLVGDQRACAEPIVTVEPVLTETPAAPEVPAEEPVITDVPATEDVSGTSAPDELIEPEATAAPAATEPAVEETEEDSAAEETAVPSDSDETVETEAGEIPAVTEPAPGIPEENTASAEPAVTETAPMDEPTGTPTADETEPAETEDVPADEETGVPNADETEPAVTESVPADEETGVPNADETEPAETEPVSADEETGLPNAAEEYAAEQASTDFSGPEEVPAAEAPEEPTPTEDLTIREISIADLTENTITFSAQESYTIAPEKINIVPEAADWAALSFRLDDETLAAFQSADIEVVKAEGLTLNGLNSGRTTLRIQAGEVEKAVTLVITLSAENIQATLDAEAAAIAAAQPVPPESTPEPAAE